MTPIGCGRQAVWNDDGNAIRAGEPDVAIHAQLLPGSAGGVEINLRRLIQALNRLDAGGRQILIGPRGDSDWLRPLLGPLQSLLPWTPIRFLGAPPPRFGLAQVSRPFQGRALARRLRGRASNADAEGDRLTRTLVDMGVSAVHFPYQRFFPTSLPSLFEPWDLQHLHFPEFFPRGEAEFREWLYREGCARARLVVTASHATKRDLIGAFGLAPEKVAVIRRGVFPHAEQSMSADVAARLIQPLRLPERFALYPAKTWRHKNHPRLFEALARLRDEGLPIPLVCTGGPAADFHAEVERRRHALRLERLVMFAGYLDTDQMRALYGQATMLVFPSLFEGGAIPVLEAMLFGLPIVASTASCIPEIAGPAAAYCEPLSTDSIIEAIRRMWTNPALQAESRVRGAARVGRFDWAAAGRKFLACYRWVSGRGLGAEDARIVTEITRSEGPADGVSLAGAL